MCEMRFGKMEEVNLVSQSLQEKSTLVGEARLVDSFFLFSCFAVRIAKQFHPLREEPQMCRC